MIKPILDKEFTPAIIEFKKFNDDVKKNGKSTTLVVAVERNDGYVYRRSFEIFNKGIDDKRNSFIIERFIKSILWIVGGYKIYLYGSLDVYNDIKSYYQDNGLRSFDYNFMSTCYEKPVEVIYVDKLEDMPKEKKAFIKAGGNLKGNRIGFDAGGSDIKVSAVKNGEVIYSEEIIWLPKLNEDINYHKEFIKKAYHVALAKLDNKVDGIGISTAGVIIANKPMVSSIFIKVPKTQFEEVKGAYINSVHDLEKELGYEIPFVVANDGDVTALAGAMDLKDNGVLGIAMGTSEAGGYVNLDGSLDGWLNELAFVPVDFNKNAMIDEWSGDYGVGCKYFSQDAVIKLAPRAGIKLDESLTLAEKLKVVQGLMEKDHEGAKQIYESIGVYLAYALAFYSEFYTLKHVLLLGRVVSGKGGDIILNVAKDTLNKEFPEYKNIDISMPSERMRRVGQSIAAASLPDNK